MIQMQGKFKPAGTLLLLLAMLLLLAFSAKAVAGTYDKEKMKETEKTVKQHKERPFVMQGNDGRNLYVYWGQVVTIPEDEVVNGDILFLGSAVIIKGKVAGTVVAVGGMITLEQGSQVEKNVSTLLAHYDQKLNSTVGGTVTTQGDTGNIGAVLFQFSWITRLFFSLMTSFSDIVIALLLIIFAKKRILSVCDRLASRPGPSLALGIVSVFAVTLLSITPLFLVKLCPYLFIVLLPVLLGITILLLSTSVASAAFLIGQTAEDRGWIKRQEFTVKGLLGLAVIGAVLALLNVIPVAGPFLAGIVASIVRLAGTGAAISTWFSGKTKVKKVEAEVEAAG